MAIERQDPPQHPRKHILDLPPRLRNEALHGTITERSAINRHVARDIINNVTELTGFDPDTYGQSAQKYLHIVSHKKYADLPHALAHTVADTFGKVAAKMGWDMDAPEVVYMSGFTVLTCLEERNAKLAADISNAKNRLFVNEASRTTQVNKERAEVESMEAPIQILTDSLATYATEQPSLTDPDYLRVLQLLAHPGVRNIHDYTYDSAIRKFEAGDIGDALRLLEEGFAKPKKAEYQGITIYGGKY